eukprot:Seg1388.5 transcript_id=Seg1388.5/GoldUCD/mRNA.D3Y31 product="Adrenodoxin mitochondrial" protein_id=Seg1388.5/GoldUCD/D3Y31
MATIGKRILRIAPRILPNAEANQQVIRSLYQHNKLTKSREWFGVRKTAERGFKTSEIAAKKTVSITFLDRDGDKIKVQANVGDSLLDVAKDHDIDVEGACEGTLACSTCHLVFRPDQYEKLGLDPPSEEELDMLDLAYGLTDTSRLGCQIEVTEDMDGLELTIPVTVDIRS